MGDFIKTSVTRIRVVGGFFLFVLQLTRAVRTENVVDGACFVVPVVVIVVFSRQSHGPQIEKV